MPPKYTPNVSVCSNQPRNYTCMTRLMRCQALCLLLATSTLLSLCLLSHAQTYAQNQGSRKQISRVQFLTMDMKNVPIREVLKSISRQTGFEFFYGNNSFNPSEKISISVKHEPLESVLYSLVNRYGLTWTYNDNAIVFSKGSRPVETVKKNLTDSSVNAQPLTGKITDAAGTPLPGATVLVKGSANGTTTNADGMFSLSNVPNESVIIISSVGFETREMAVKGRKIAAALNIDINNLDETVVVAYSTTTKRLSTGNITTIKGEEIARQPVNNGLLALQGRATGVFITQSNGLPGTAVNVQVQGPNSIGYGNDPFYVVDGVPYASQLLGNNAFIYGSFPRGNNGNPFSYLNPSDIESVTILKDADATAIYGSRAANGAILITTRKGKAGRMKVDVNLQQGWGKVTRKMDLLDNKQYLAMRHEAILNDGGTVQPWDYDLNGVWDTTRNTDWQRQLIGNTAKYSTVSASLSGGTSQAQYLIGGTYHRETSVFPGNFADAKGSIHFNISSSSADQRFKAQLTGNYMVDENRLPQVDLTMPSLYLQPDAPEPFNPDGSLNWMPDPATGMSTWFNPYARLLAVYKNKTKNLVSNAVLSYEILNGLVLKSNFGYTNLQTNDIATVPLSSVNPDWLAFTPRTATYGDYSITSWIVEPQLSIKRGIGQGKLEAMVGTSIQQNHSVSKILIGSGYNSDQVLEDIASASNITTSGSVNTVYKYNALFGRLNYNWADKYVLNISARRDGSSRFGSANRFHNFGAAGLAWIFSQEQFVKKALPVLSFGKLRVSYGTTGNDQIGDYSYLNRYIPVSVANPYQGIVGLQPNSLTNPYLQWEETRKWQAGLELGFLKDRITFVANYSRNRSSNQLLNYSLPIVTGFKGIARNFPATVENRNWEFTFNTVNIRGNAFSWSTAINLTIPRNKLIAFPNLATSNYGKTLIIGQSISIRRLYHLIGVNDSTGVYQFSDSKGNITTSPSYSDDRIAVVNTDPKFYGGIDNSFTYKGFELDVFFQFVKQQGINYFFGNSPGTFYGGNQPAYVLQRWQKAGDKTPIQRFNSDYSIDQQFANAAFTSDGSVSDASYIRLKNISLFWQLPQPWRKKMRLQNCKVFFQAQNLLTITGFKGLDPETQSSATLPPLRMMTTGIQIGL